MSLETQIIDGNSSTPAKVTSNGQLVVAPVSYDQTSFKELSTTSAFNFYLPKADQQFVVTGIIAQANKDVSNVTTATIIVYEGSSLADATADKVLLEFVLVRFGVFDSPPLNIIVNEGKFINATTSDASIFMTVMGYYIPKIN